MFEFHRVKKKIVPRDSFSLKNTGVDARALKDKLEMEMKAANDGSASCAALEKKAEFHEKLVRGKLSDEEDLEKCCVDFCGKGAEQVSQQHRGSDVSTTAPAEKILILRFYRITTDTRITTHYI